MELDEGMVAVVTGGASGIGLEVSRRLASEGLTVVAADVNGDRVSAVAEELRGEGLDVRGEEVDVASFESVQGLADRVYAAHGAVHVLHLNAGVAGGGSLFDDQTANWERVIGINLLGVAWGIKAFVSRMIEGGHPGYVVGTTSGAGAEGTSYSGAAYSGTKAAVVTVMECLYGQLRDRGSAVKAGVLYPPLTATHLAGDPATMPMIEKQLNSTGVPATLVQPAQVAALFVDGIKRDRFFIRAGAKESAECFNGAITDEFLEWNERMIRGRGEAELADGYPDGYLW